MELDYSAAVKASTAEPYTSVPYKCSLCDQDVYVWKYHMLDYSEQQHQQAVEQ